MLLETLDLRTNDILIYSQNLFNFNDSFKIVYKNHKMKSPKRISYFDVCNYIKDPSPKNLIIYRLLTNVNSLDAYSTKYGYFIKINGRMELIYFDPVFAIKDLRHLRFDLDPNHFRFKIQQVGLTSLTKWEGEPDFGEVYCFDLKAIEAQNQNDKIYADAIFAFDPSFKDEEPDEFEMIKNDNVKIPDPFQKKETEKSEVASIGNILEDKQTESKNLQSLNAPEPQKADDLREEIISILKQALNIPELKDLKQDLKKNETKEEQFETKSSDNEPINLFDLFKTTNKSDELSSRERENIVLKFEKSF